MTPPKSGPHDLLLFLLAGAGGCLYLLGFLGFGLWPLLAIFLLPLWWSLDQVGPRQWGGALGLGFVFGFVAFAGGHLWLFALIEIFFAGNVLLGGVLWLIYAVGFASGFAVYAGLYALLRGRGWGLLVSGVAPLLLLEWLQPWPFPVHSGAGLVDVTRVAQIADVGGTLVLSGLVGIVNWMLFESLSWLRVRGRPPYGVWLGATCVALAVGLYGSQRITHLDGLIETAPSLRVGIVQANLGKLEKRTQAIVSHRRHLAMSRQLLREGEVDLIVWPETAYARALLGPLPLSARLVRSDLDVPLLFGATLLDRPGTDSVQYNSALLVGQDGMIRSAYRKNLLIPIAESIPLVGLVPGLAARLPHAQHFTAATSKPALELDAFRIAAPICYEVVRPDFVRAMVLESRANLLVTLANDAWFGDSQEPWIHLQLARMRAIEHRRYLVRATNSGISAIVDPIGRVVAHTGILESTTLRGQVHRMEVKTLYARLGDWPGLLAAAVVLFGLTPAFRSTASDLRE